MTAIEGLGYLASCMVFIAFYMKTMVPLRMLAIGSNVVFIVYGIAEHLYPIVVLHTALLPLNLQRLIQIRKLIRQVEESTDGELDLKSLLPFMARSTYRNRDVLFSKGESADAMYYIAEGNVLLKEIDVTVGVGDVIGEIGLFTPEGTRTATAVCQSRCQIYKLTSNKLYEQYYQNPKFAFALLRLITLRLVENAKSPEK
jgi:CRP/FNR family cyclic AMP-dependent transcriptional regulator